jgi:hypothetical protein
MEFDPYMQGNPDPDQVDERILTGNPNQILPDDEEKLKEIQQLMNTFEKRFPGQVADPQQAMQALSGQQPTQPTEPQPQNVEQQFNQVQAEYDAGQQQEQQPQEPVNNLQEARNIVPNALDAITTDIQQYGYGPEWTNPREKEAPELKTTWGRIFSDLFQAIVPVLVVGAITKGGIRKLPNIASRFPKGGKMDWIGGAALDMGLEVGWLNISRQAKADNITGMLAEKGIPLPDWLATKDSDSPETKRIKQQYEAVGFGLFGTTIAGLWKLAKGGRFIDNVVPTNKAGKELVDDIKAKDVEELSENPMVDNMMRDENARVKSDDAMAEARHAEDPEITKVDTYVQSELFDEFERVPKAVHPDGVLEAMTDNYKIQRNIETDNGRMARTLTEPAIEGMSRGGKAAKKIMGQIEEALHKLRNQGLKISLGGKWVTNKKLLTAADELVKKVYGAESWKQAQSMFELMDVKTISGETVQIFTPASQVAAGKIMRDLLDQGFDPDSMRASSLIQTGLANDLMDSAVASNNILKELPMDRVQERMMRVLETLTYMRSLTGSYSGWLLQVNKLPWEKVQNPKIAEWYAKAQERLIKVKKLHKELNDPSKVSPKMKEALMGAYELTDGSVVDIQMLQQAIEDSVKARRGIKNWGYESPALLIQGIQSLFYAAKLSSFYTPAKAIANNMSNYMMKPITKVIGSFGKEFDRAYVQYAAGLVDTNRITAQFFSDRFKQVQTLPLEKVVRTDLAEKIGKQNEWLETAQAYAEATGDLVFQTKVNMARTMIAMGNHPFLRYSTNIMDANDVAMNVGLILTDKRGKMFDEIMERSGKVTAKDVEAINKWTREEGAKYVRENLDPEDFKPKDPAIRYAGEEMAMNMDTTASRGVGAVLNRSPILKTFALFPTTALNSISFFGKHSPLSQDLFNIRKLEGNPEAISKFLGQKGIEFTEANWEIFKAETRGRVVLGTTVMGYAFTMWSQGNMTGNGIYDKSVNQASSDLARTPNRSWRLYEGGPWMSYDGIEPISSLLALTIDIADNFSTIGTAPAEDLWAKIAYIFGDNITNKSFVQGLRPLFEGLAGKTGFLPAYTANLTSVSILQSLSRSIDPAMRVVQDDFMSQLRNKWNILDVIGVGEPLPYARSPVTGEKIAPLNPIGSSLFPVRMQSSQTPDEEFLRDIEFATSGAMSTILGQDLTPQQQAEIQRRVGENGYFRKQIARIRKSNMYKEDLAQVKRYRSKNIGSDKFKWKKTRTYQKTYEAYERAIRQAKLEVQRTDKTLLDNVNQEYRRDRATQLGDYETLDKLLNIN